MWAAVDVETTGLHPVRDRIVEIAVIRLGPHAEKIDEWSTLVNPGEVSLGGRIHGLRRAGVKDAPSFSDIRDELLERLANLVLVAHNAPFDVSFLQSETIRDGVACHPSSVVIGCDGRASGIDRGTDLSPHVSLNRPNA
jgi:DNA polymerase III epsilon subunit-like protein